MNYALPVEASKHGKTRIISHTPCRQETQSVTHHASTDTVPIDAPYCCTSIPLEVDGTQPQCRFAARLACSRASRPWSSSSLLLSSLTFASSPSESRTTPSGVATFRKRPNGKGQPTRSPSRVDDQTRHKIEQTNNGWIDGSNIDFVHLGTKQKRQNGEKKTHSCHATPEP